jgi:uncharacterized protein involved in exopolysaccharide biosynthesis
LEELNKQKQLEELNKQKQLEELNKQKQLEELNKQKQLEEFICNKCKIENNYASVNIFQGKHNYDKRLECLNEELLENSKRNANFYQDTSQYIMSEYRKNYLDIKKFMIMQEYVGNQLYNHVLESFELSIKSTDKFMNKI